MGGGWRVAGLYKPRHPPLAPLYSFCLTTGEVNGRSLERRCPLHYHPPMLKQRLARIFALALILGLLLWLLTPNWPKFGDETYQLEAIVGGARLIL
jgi:hypothetical protein